MEIMGENVQKFLYRCVCVCMCLKLTFK